MQQPQQFVPPSPACTRCGRPATWYAQTAQWGCDHCQIPVVPYQQVDTGSQAGMIVLKIFLFILMVGVIVAIKVGIRGAFR